MVGPRFTSIHQNQTEASCFTYILVTRESLRLANDQAAFIRTIILGSAIAVSMALAVSATNSTSSLRQGYSTNTPRARTDEALDMR